MATDLTAQKFYDMWEEANYIAAGVDVNIDEVGLYSDGTPAPWLVISPLGSDASWTTRTMHLIGTKARTAIVASDLIVGPDSKYPHICSTCGAAAYVGLNTVDCSNGC